MTNQPVAHLLWIGNMTPPTVRCAACFAAEEAQIRADGIEHEALSAEDFAMMLFELAVEPMEDEDKPDPNCGKCGTDPRASATFKAWAVTQGPVVHQADPYTRQYPICAASGGDVLATMDLERVTCAACLAARALPYLLDDDAPVRCPEHPNGCITPGSAVVQHGTRRFWDALVKGLTEGEEGAH